MSSTRIDGSGYDYDWFAVDADNHLIHFASGGGFLPESVAISREKLSVLKQFFDTLPEITINQEITLTPEAIGDSSSFLHFVRRGFYSFDKTDLNDPDGPLYQLIAQPPRFITVADLPANIALALSQTCFPISAANLTVIDITTIN